MEKGFYKPTSPTNSIYNIQGPLELTSKALPDDLKLSANNKIQNLMVSMKTRGFRNHFIDQLRTSINWAESESTHELYKIHFQNEIKRLDSIRTENFVETFPELKQLLD